MTASEALRSRLGQHYVTYREVNTRIALTSCKLAALEVRAEHPEATGIVLEWSDQGSFLHFTEVLAGDDVIEDQNMEDWLFDLNPETAWNLGENNESIWKALCNTKLVPAGDRYRGADVLDIERCLQIEDGDL